MRFACLGLVSISRRVWSMACWRLVLLLSLSRAFMSRLISTLAADIRSATLWEGVVLSLLASMVDNHLFFVSGDRSGFESIRLFAASMVLTPSLAISRWSCLNS